MIVLDASAVAEILLRSPIGEGLAAELLSPEGEFHERELHAPHLVDAEVAQVLRRFNRQGELAAERGRGALEDLADLPIHRHAHGLLLPRVWELRQVLTAYDGLYVALAEALSAPLFTCDARLAGAPGLRAPVRVCGG